jgi:hypothetical protein
MGENENTRCAPSKEFKEGSCFTLDSLKVIAVKYNEHNTDKINITDDKLKLVEDITNKFSSSCSTQTCWLRTNLLKNINNEEITNNTFRPVGPKNKYEWLSTTNINDVIDQYHSLNKEFLFLGTLPYDFQELKELGLNNFNFDKVLKEGKYKLGMVINLDESHQSGSHWVGLYTDLKKNQIYFFDSVGKPPRKKIKTFINKIVEFFYKKKYNKDIDVSTVMSLIKQVNNKDSKRKYLNILNTNLNPFDIRYNNIQHQFKNSECGVYSINFIVRSLRGESFDNIINNITSDDKMNECRQAYFVNT